MATLVLGAVGAAVGGSIGGSLLGLSAAVLGRAAGAAVGRAIDQRLLGTGSDAVEVGRIDRFRLSGASEGAPIPRVLGRVRLGGQVIWSSRFKETTQVSGGGGKGAPSQPKQTNFSYSVSFALALCEGPITRIGRVWADGAEIARDSINMRVHVGTPDQLPDGLIEAIEGAAPAYRGVAYVVVEDLDLSPYGNRVPQLSFEVVRHVDAEGCVPGPENLVEGVALVPGTGEYALATRAVHYDYGNGEKDSANVNTPEGIADMRVALRDLTEEMPRVGAASLVVSWFGDDLRCGSCTVRPRVEQDEVDGTPMAWTVSGAGRVEAGTVPRQDGRPIYGGTPSDGSVVQAIREMAGRGLDVTFYPFILMDQLAGNGRPDPWGGEEQAPLPWRGRITTAEAPGRAGSTDGTAGAAAEVATFFGTASAADFEVLDGQVAYSGPPEWSYRRFILHYAALCAAAGGVEAFCVGSEMRALTQIRGPNGMFPAVDALRDLTAEVRQLLPDAKLGYAADWSEYFGYHPADTGDLHFHLDPLWADPEIDFVGIDNYMPLADWRQGEDHADAGWRSVRNLDYLRAQVEGGEGFDWYYPTPEARDAQRRIPITDGDHGEPWVWRYKDVRSWWKSHHHERIGGVRSATPTAWMPQSKPIRFTEYGCAAIDRGANQPNKFLDPKSSESALPHYSTGRRDDAMQMQYLRGLLSHWRDPERNPISAAYGGPMLDLAHSFAWAWDTRPWPAFPDLTSFWSDGANHARGHWISGRSGAVPLDVAIKSICADAGVVDVDVSAVEGVVHGYTASAVQSARADLQALLIAHGVDGFEQDGVLRFALREDATRHEVLASSFAKPTDGAAFSVSRAPEAETPGRVRLRHMEAGGAFEIRVSDAAHPGASTASTTETELPVTLTNGAGHALAERFLTEARVARDVAKLHLPPSRADVRVGDRVRVADSAGLWRVDRLETAELRVLDLVRTEAHAHVPSDAVEDGRGRLRPLAPLPVEPVVMDLPLLTGDEVPHAPTIAVAARPWPGVVAVHAAAGGGSFRLNTSIDGPSTIGVTQTELPRARAGVWDHGPALRIKLFGGALASVDSDALFAGANALAIGDDDLDGWEILQFRDAALLEPGVWTLSARLRGQRGTDPFIRDPWPIGSRVVLLDGAQTQLDLPLDARGVPRTLRIGPARLPVDHEAYVDRHLTPDAVGLRPYAPAHLRWRAGVDGGVNLSWVRRGRIAADSWNVPDVPLGEVAERYVVVISRADGQVLHETEVGAQQLGLSAAQLAQITAAGGVVHASVAQVSDLYGPGHWATVRLA